MDRARAIKRRNRSPGEYCQFVMNRIRRWAAIVGVGLILIVAGASAAAADTTRRDADGAPGSTIKVGIKPLDPFVTKNGDQYHGFSIDLWKEIARRNSWQTSYVWHDTLPPLLRDVQTSTVDVGIAGITITKDREQVLDFSYPMFIAGLEVMTTSRGSSSNWTSELASFVTAGVGRYLLALLVALIIAGHLVWLGTRRRTQLGYLAGVGLGIYKAAGLGLVGDYGVADPKRPLGRAAAVMWTIVGVSFVSLFTAALASQLTVRNIESKITGVQDLSGAKVATVTGSSAAGYPTAHAITFTGVPTINDAYRQLDSGKVDAIVFDAPVLQNHLKLTRSTNQTLVGGILARENYGIALPTGSALRKKINETLLDITADGTYDELYSKYFEDANSG
ncbi:MAG: transporter substrate-binding domain-containing protein [Pseudonocardiales bacterium]|nr:transporter substrate-binding domain-containing protein [Pseudonocardiales bacterium]